MAKPEGRKTAIGDRDFFSSLSMLIGVGYVCMRGMG